MSAVLIVVGVFTDAARINLAHSHVLRANKIAVSSLLASYNNQLKDEYGLFGVYQDNDTILENYESYLTKNLNIDGKKDLLYDFNIEQYNISSESDLLNKNLFEKQINEFMKYRAPCELADDLLTKVKGMKDIKGSSNICKRMFDTDKKASVVGELQKSLETKANKISELGITTKVEKLRNTFLDLNKKYQECTQKINSLKSLSSIEKDVSKISNLLRQIESVENELSTIKSTKLEIKSNIVDQLNEFIDINKEAILNAKDISAKKIDLLNILEKENVYINSTNDGIKEIQDSYKTDISNIQNIISEDNCENIIESLNKNITNCTNILTNVNIEEDDFLSELEKLSNLNINYRYNKVKPAKSDDEDNRDRIDQSLKKSFELKGESKTITNVLLKQLPSKKSKISDEPSNDKYTDFDISNVNSINGYLDDLFLSNDGTSNTSLPYDFADIGTLASRITQDIYVNEYIIGTFKHDVPLLKGEKDSDSFNLRSTDKNLRDGYFDKFEVEYIINGNKSEDINSALTKSKILAIRLVSNAIHIYTDPSKMSRVISLAAGLSTWSAGLSMPLIQTIVLFSWAMAESIYDVDQLIKGEKIPLMKIKQQWRTDISGTVNKKTDANSEKNLLSLSYHDYLKIFLLSMNQDNKITRVQDLVQLNMGISNACFLLEDCKIMLRTNTNVSIKNIFLSIPSFLPNLKKKISRTYISEDICIGYY